MSYKAISLSALALVLSVSLTGCGPDLEFEQDQCELGAKKDWKRNSLTVEVVSTCREETKSLDTVWIRATPGLWDTQNPKPFGTPKGLGTIDAVEEALAACARGAELSDDPQERAAPYFNLTMTFGDNAFGAKDVSIPIAQYSVLNLKAREGDVFSHRAVSMLNDLYDWAQSSVTASIKRNCHAEVYGTTPAAEPGS